MRKMLAIGVVALSLGALPSLASAQETQMASSGGGAAVATIAGAVIGGAIGYYYVTGTAATVVGAVVGGAIGRWWYRASESSGYDSLPRKQSYRLTSRAPFQLIGFGADDRPAMRLSAASEAAAGM
jgi:hypothetical protein